MLTMTGSSLSTRSSTLPPPLSAAYHSSKRETSSPSSPLRVEIVVDAPVCAQNVVPPSP
jgi:hypothetical protein